MPHDDDRSANPFAQFDYTQRLKNMQRKPSSAMTPPVPGQLYNAGRSSAPSYLAGHMRSPYGAKSTFDPYITEMNEEASDAASPQQTQPFAPIEPEEAAPLLQPAQLTTPFAPVQPPQPAPDLPLRSDRVRAALHTPNFDPYDHDDDDPAPAVADDDVLPPLASPGSPYADAPFREWHSAPAAEPRAFAEAAPFVPEQPAEPASFAPMPWPDEAPVSPEEPAPFTADRAPWTDEAPAHVEAPAPLYPETADRPYVFTPDQPAAFSGRFSAPFAPVSPEEPAHAEPSAPFYPETSDRPYVFAPDAPYTPDAEHAPPADVPRDEDAAMDPPDENAEHKLPRQPRISIWRALSIAAVTVMLMFCVLASADIIAELSQNEQEVARAREEYLRLNGSELLTDATRVELLPVGQTYPPTPTPSPTRVRPTPTPARVSVMATSALNRSTHTPLPDGVTPTPPVTPTPNPRTRLTAYPKNEMRNLMPSLLELRKLNAEYANSNDIVGRLVINGVLDEVVVQRNNSFYLTHNYRASFSEAGAVFVDESCSFFNPPENLLLRGQGTVSGKTFAPLWQYATAGRDFVASATRAVLTTPYEEETYVLFAVIEAATDPSSPRYFNYASHPTFPTDAAMLQYVDQARSRSLYQFNVDIQPGDRLLTLATVSNGDSCIVLLFRMVR